MHANSNPVLAPFRSRPFLVIWTATVISNVGTWMYNAGSGWLMSSLDASPLMVSLVQAAASLPMFLLTLPAGALTDMFDKRRFLIIGESATTLVAFVLAGLIALRLIDPRILLLFTFLLGVGSALTAPGWQAIVPSLVDAKALPAAVAANSVGINLSRAVGPALGGLTIAALGIAAPFWINAISNLAVILALLWWGPPERAVASLPAERFFAALTTGLRHARHNADLRGTLKRALGFFSFASAYWALLPLIARTQVGGGPQLYGLLLGAIGTGAVGGAFLLPSLKQRLGRDGVVTAGTLGTALALALYGLARNPLTALAASLIGGLSWIAVIANLNVAAQVSLPDWVRGRGVALLMTAYFGGMTVGSVVWGQVATSVGVPVALFTAAAGALIILPLTSGRKLPSATGRDLSPSLAWPEPVSVPESEHDRGPVLVTVEYRVRPSDRTEFLQALRILSGERRRDGAYAWDVFEDVADVGRFLETWMLDSWVEHLRQHARTTREDQVTQSAVNRFHSGGQPKITHYIAAPPTPRKP
jgi:MFS family permease